MTALLDPCEADIIWLLTILAIAMSGLLFIPAFLP